MKNVKQIVMPLAVVLLMGTVNEVKAQTPDWNTSGNAIGGTNFFGSTNNFPLNIRTNNTLRAQFTTGGTFGTGSTLGDGLRFFDPGGGPGNLDLWTSSSNQTHIRWDGNGTIQGANGRFEFIGNFNGLWFNTTTGTGRYLFNRNGTETGRVGLNDFWRIGLNATNVDAARRLDVFDATTPQLRLTQTNNTVFADFQTNANGNLLINPSGTRLGLNLGTTNPSHTLEVNGNARFRNLTAATTPNSLLVGVNVSGANDVELRRIAFTGNTTNVLLGDGTWGTISAGGGVGNYCGTTPKPLTNHFEIPMDGYNYYFTAPQGANSMSSVNIGNLTCATQVPARLNVVLDEPMGSSVTHVAMGGEILAASLPQFTPQYSVAGVIRNSHSANHAGVLGISTTNANVKNIGVQGQADKQRTTYRARTR